MKNGPNPHRPDVKPGRGFRILENGEEVQGVDEVQTARGYYPFKRYWVRVDIGPPHRSLIGKKVDCNFAAIRTNRPL